MFARFGFSHWSPRDDDITVTLGSQSIRACSEIAAATRIRSATAAASTALTFANWGESP